MTSATDTPLAMAGVVLAGGQSVRMGTNKAVLVVDGERMVDRALNALTAGGASPLFVSGTAAADSDSEAEFAPTITLIGDAYGAEGPMGGIVSTWEHLCQLPGHVPDGLVVLSCDLPLITGDIVAALVAAAATTSHGAVANDGDRVQPLVAAYRTKALDFMVRAWHDGERSVRRLFEHLTLASIQAPERSRDADEPADLGGHHVAWPSDHEYAAPQ